MVTKLSSIVVNSYRASLDNAYYTFDLKTEHIVPENGKLRFNLPDTSFTGNSCSILTRSTSFSDSMFCNLSENTASLSYVFANKPDFQGETALQVTLSEVIN